MHMAAVNLASPTITDLDFAVAGGSAIANDEMVGETVFHSTHPTMVIVEHTRVTLSCAAVMDDDEFPPVAGYRRASNLFDNGSGEIAVSFL